MKSSRLLRALALLRQDKSAAFLVTAAPDIQYLLGLESLGPEREAVLLLTPAKAVLFLDSRKTGSGLKVAVEMRSISAARPLAAALGATLKELAIKRLAFDSENLTVAEFGKLKTALKGVALIKGENIIRRLRLLKDEPEIAAVTAAVRLADEAFREILPTLKVGETERAIAWLLEKIMREKGADGLAFPPMVAVGENSAIPHYAPGDERVEPGKNILLDFGCRVNGYCSDITRTVFVGSVNSRQRRQYETVLAAQQAALKSLQVSIASGKVDEAARRVVEQAGFPDFNHGLGHGIGLEIHEAPYLRPGRTDKLEAGTVFSVEPGVYIAGEMGVRIEDLVLMTPAGPRVLTQASKKLMILSH